MLLNEKVAVITGGGSGVGRESAKLFAREGAKVIIGDIRDDWGLATARYIDDLGGSAHFVRTDVTVEGDVKALIQTAIDTHGHMDIMFNNVGIASPRPRKVSWEYSDADWNRLLNTNLWGVIYGCRHAIPALIDNGGGVVINTGSAAGMVAWGGIPYGVTKAGVIHLTKGLASEVTGHNIRVNCICPGAIDTNFGKVDDLSTDVKESSSSNKTKDLNKKQTGAIVPLGRSSDPAEIAQAALYLASDMSSYVTGTALVVDGGYTML